MNCKFCNAELEEGITLCPACGKENAAEPEIPEEAVEEEMVPEVSEELTEEISEEISEQTEEVTEAEALEEEPAVETPKKKTPKWLIALIIAGVIAIAAVLGAAVYFGLDAAGLNVKSYTVTEAKAESVRDVVVGKVGDVALTNSALQVYYWQAISDFYNSYGYYLDASVLDFEKPLDQQFYDEETKTTWQQFFVDGALTTWSRYAALCMQAQQEGYVLPEDVQAYLEEIPAQLKETAAMYGFDTVEAMLAADMSPVCDENGYMDYFNNNFYAGQYLDHKYETLIPSMEEIAAYYAQNEATLNEQGIANDGSIAVDVRHILVTPEGGTEDETGEIVYSDAEWDACRTTAQTILDQWQAAGATEELFAQFAMEYTMDPGSQSTGGLYTDVYQGQMVQPFNDWCFDESRQYGDTGLVQTNYGYHVMFFVDSEEIWIANVRDNLIYDRSLALVDGAVEAWPMEVDYKKIAIGEPVQTADEEPADAAAESAE